MGLVNRRYHPAFRFETRRLGAMAIGFAVVLALPLGGLALRDQRRHTTEQILLERFSGAINESYAALKLGPDKLREFAVDRVPVSPELELRTRLQETGFTDVSLSWERSNSVVGWADPLIYKAKTWNRVFYRSKTQVDPITVITPDGRRLRGYRILGVDPGCGRFELKQIEPSP